MVRKCKPENREPFVLSSSRFTYPTLVTNLHCKLVFLVLTQLVFLEWRIFTLIRISSFWSFRMKQVISQI